MRAITFLGVLCTLVLELQAQDIIGIRTRWSDSFREWVVLTTDDFQEGSIEMRWELRDDWTEWEFRLGDTIADIRQKWEQDPNEWQIRCAGELVAARTVWTGDFTEWRITNGRTTIVWKSKYKNILDEWETSRGAPGLINFYTYYERDPREWVLHEELEEDIGIAMRIALIFIAAYHSSPKV